MATQKKKATAVAQKSKSGVAAKKATPPKKVVAKKAAAKTVTAKKALPAKTAPAKKASAKTAPAKKSPVKSVGKNTPAKKTAPVAKKSTTISRKEAPAKKAIAKKTAAVKASPKKVTPAKKAASKLKSAPSKVTHSTKKLSPVKNTAKTGAKKAVINKLATPKKVSEKEVKKPALKENVKKPVTAAKTAKIKAVVPAEPDTIVTHKAELKKALTKAKMKEKETKKASKTFVMPKTNTDKSIKYSPHFTKSVLDQAPQEYTGPTMRYSDNELVEFRELIERKLETAKKELGYLQGLITRKDQMGGDDTDNRYMTMEDGGLSMEREQLSQMASRQITFIDHLEKAMMRIENKTYGICRVTGKLIDKARLRAVPHATLSIEAKMGR